MSCGRKTKTKPTYLECENCKNVVTIQRRLSKMHGHNHVKHMYCYKCKQVTPHIEKKEELFFPEWIKESDTEGVQNANNDIN